MPDVAKQNSLGFVTSLLWDTVLNDCCAKDRLLGVNMLRRVAYGMSDNFLVEVSVKV